MPLPKPKRKEAYTEYVARCHKHVKRNKTAVKGVHVGRGKNRKLHMPSLTKKIGRAWRMGTRNRK